MLLNCLYNDMYNLGGLCSYMFFIMGSITGFVCVNMT